MLQFYDYQGDAICEACSENIPGSERDGPHHTHWFQCQECKREFDTDDFDGQGLASGAEMAGLRDVRTVQARLTDIGRIKPFADSAAYEAEIGRLTKENRDLRSMVAQYELLVIPDGGGKVEGGERMMDIIARLTARANDATTFAGSYAGQRQHQQFLEFAAAMREGRDEIELLSGIYEEALRKEGRDLAEVERLQDENERYATAHKQLQAELDRRRNMTLEIAVIEWGEARKAWLDARGDSASWPTPEWERFNTAEIRLYDLAKRLRRD